LRRLHRKNILAKDTVFPSLDRHCAKEGKNCESNKPLSTVKDDGIANAIDCAKTKARNTLEMLGMDTQLKVESLWEKDYILHDMSIYNDGDNDDA